MDRGWIQVLIERKRLVKGIVKARFLGKKSCVVREKKALSSILAFYKKTAGIRGNAVHKQDESSK
jgi:hypothetical protein